MIPNPNHPAPSVPAPAHEESLPADPHGLWDLVHLDRYRNGGTRDYSAHAAYTEALPAYRPDGGLPYFDLPAWWLPRSALEVFTAHPPTCLANSFLRDGMALFCVHPQVVAQCPTDPYLRRTIALGVAAPPVDVSPSSSTRTLYARGGSHPHALKVHFPFRVSRYHRRMRSEVIQQAVAVSAQMEAHVHELGADFAFMREVLGFAHRDPSPSGDRSESWGYLVRDLVPCPAGPPRSRVPGFALYGVDATDPARPPLVLEWIGDADPVGWTLEELFLPIVRHWIRCFLDLGFILEPHGQNVVLEREGKRVVRIVHRDLSVGIDMRRRRDLGLPDGDLNGYNRMEDGGFTSIAYDRFMGGHFFDALLRRLLDAYPGLRADDFRGPVREEFAALFPEHAHYMPRSVIYFSEERDRFGKPRHEDTGQAPVWRP